MAIASLLDLDPDLGEALTPERFEVVRQRLGVRHEHVDPADWSPPDDAESGLGLLVTGGFMVRTVALEHRQAAEILGPGDLLRPWQDDGDHAVYPFSSAWRVLQPVTAAILDRQFMLRAAAVPELTEAFVKRAFVRSRRVAGHLVLAQFASVEHRVLLALWHLADLWGKVRADGIILPIPLTHEIIGQIVGARRPAVSAALGALESNGRACPELGGGFLLHGEPPADLQLLRGARPRAAA